VSPRFKSSGLESRFSAAMRAACYLTTSLESSSNRWQRTGKHSAISFLLPTAPIPAPLLPMRILELGLEECVCAILEIEESMAWAPDPNLWNSEPEKGGFSAAVGKISIPASG
jgi:hypothetical protein